MPFDVKSKIGPASIYNKFILHSQILLLMHCAVTRKETSSTTKGEQEKIFGVRKIDLVTPSYRNASGTIGYRWEKTNVFFIFAIHQG